MFGIDHSLRELAYWVWNEQNLARHHGLKLQEETITEMLLLKIATVWQGRGLSVKMFNRIEEGGSKRTKKKGNGADWEWFIKTDTCQIGFRVQAKVLSSDLTKNGALSIGKYESLDRKQATQLISSAKDVGFNPIYIFYNHPWVSNRALFSAALHSFPVVEGDWGCSVAKAGFINATSGNNLQEMIGGMMPWHLFFSWGAKCEVMDRLRNMKGDQPLFERSPEPDWLPFFRLPQFYDDGPRQSIEAVLDKRDLDGVALFDFTKG